MTIKLRHCGNMKQHKQHLWARFWGTVHFPTMWSKKYTCIGTPDWAAETPEEILDAAVRDYLKATGNEVIEFSDGRSSIYVSSDRRARSSHSPRRIKTDE